MATSSVSAKGTIATFNVTALGRVTNVQLDDGAIDLDDTDLSHTRENHQLGIDTVSGSIDCLVAPNSTVVKGHIGDLVLSGAISKDFGKCIVTNVSVGAPVKGQLTTKYTVMACAEAAVS